MKKTKGTIAILIIMMICLSLLVACGGNSSNNSENSPSNTDSNASGNSNDSASPSSSSQFGDAAGSSQAPLLEVDEEEDVRYAEVINVIIDNTPTQVLSPFVAGAGLMHAGNWVFKLTHDTLVRSLGGGEYEPQLATHWETDDWQTFTFHLREDVYYTNGENLKASDVIWTIDRAKEAVGSGANSQWRTVVEYTAVDDYTVKFVLDTVNVDILSSIANPSASIHSKKAMTDDPVRGSEIGTGAFYVTDFVVANSVSVERNDSYWGEPAVTKTIHFRFVPEQGTRTIMMLNGEADLCFRISDEDLSLFEEDSNFNVRTFAQSNAANVIFNMEDPLMADYDFRMAVGHCLDKEEIAFVAAYDYADLWPDGTMWGYETEFRNTDIPMIEFNRDLAKEFLDKSSYNGEPVEIVAALGTNIRIAECLQRQLGYIGITITINQMDSAGYSEYTRNGSSKAQMIAYGTAFTEVASSFRGAVYPGAVGNTAQYDNPRVTELIDLAPTILDRSEREKVYKEIQSIIAEDPPWWGLFYRYNTIVAHKNIGGWTMRSDQAYDMRYMFLKLD